MTCEKERSRVRHLSGFLRFAPTVGGLWSPYVQRREVSAVRLKPVENAQPDPVDPIGALLAATAAGDRDAFAQLYDVVAAAVHGIALRVLRSPAHAEEVTQEVFLEVWTHAARYDRNRGSARAWIITMAHRRAVDRVRSVRASQDRAVSAGVREVAPLPDETAETVERRFEQRRVRAAMARLSEQQRRALELSYYSGFTHREVAEAIDVPLGTAKTRIRDGMIRLRDELGVAQ